MTDQEAVQLCREENNKVDWPYVPDVFRERFVSPFEQYADRVGQRFTILGRDLESEEKLDQHEFMYRIRFEDATEITALGEEVCVADDERRTT